MTERALEFAKDLLRGVGEIAEFLYGTRETRVIRRTYHVIASSNVPVFRLGSMICARRSVLLQWVKDQEERKKSAGATRDSIVVLP